MSAKQTVEAMAKARWPGLNIHIMHDIHPIRKEEYVCVCLNIHDTRYYAGTTFTGETLDNRDHMLLASILLDRLEREMRERYGIMTRCPL